MKHYWMAFCNDGVELFGEKRATREEAIEDCKKAFRFDFEECGHDPGLDYYIEEYMETENETFVRPAQYFKMTMGPRGGVRCKRIKNV